MADTREDLEARLAAQPRSYRPMVRDYGSTRFASNALRFASETEAQLYLTDLSMRWTAVAETRVDPCDDLPNYEWVDDRARPIKLGDPS